MNFSVFCSVISTLSRVSELAVGWYVGAQKLGVKLDDTHKIV